MRKDNSEKSKGRRKKECEFTYKCPHCPEEFYSNHPHEGTVLAPHLRICSMRPKIVSCEQKAGEEIDFVFPSDWFLAEQFGNWSDMEEEDYCQGMDDSGCAMDDGCAVMDCGKSPDHIDFGDFAGTPGDLLGDDVDVGPTNGEGGESDADGFDSDDSYCPGLMYYNDEEGDCAAEDDFVDDVGAVKSPPPRESMGCIDVTMETSELRAKTREEIGRGCWYQTGQYVNTPLFASDYFCKDYVAAYKVGRDSSDKASHPDVSMLEYQQTLIEVYFTPVGADSAGGAIPFKMNKTGGQDKDWRDCALIYFFCNTYKLMSSTGGNAFLAVVRAICGNHGVILPLHLNWRNMTKVVEKKLETFHPLFRYVWHLPTDIFGSVGTDGKPLKPAVSVSYDLMKSIALELLFVDPDEFAFGPPVPQRTRIIEGFETSDVFINLCAAVRLEKGADKIPLCVHLSWDESTNRARSTALTPMTFSLQQTRGKSERVNLAGYFPRGLVQSDKELVALLRRRNCTAVGLAQEAIAETNRKLQLDYSHSVISVLMQYEAEGLLLQVGTGVKSRVVHAFPFATSIVCDTPEADKFNGTSYGKKGMNCRQCTSQETFSMPETKLGGFEVRDSKLMAKIVRTSEQITVQKLYNCREALAAKERIDAALTAREKSRLKRAASQLGPTHQELYEWKQVELERCFFALTSGENRNYEITSMLERLGVLPHHLICPTEKLHTVGKGVFECGIAWTVLLIQSFDFVLGTSGLTTVDNFISEFPLHQSFSPVRSVKFPDGISVFLKAESSGKKGQSTGHISGSCTQCSFYLPPCGDIVIWLIFASCLQPSCTHGSKQ